MKHNWENCFDISSEYWKKVEKIYEENESFPKKVVKERNLHHKFPKSFSKKDGAEIDNDADNLVSLSLADHFRVHYYLWKCSKKGYRGMMAIAFNFMRKKMVKYATDETIEKLAKDYETAMKEAAEASSKAQKGKHLSEEMKKKMSEAHKGHLVSEATRNKMSKAQKGRPSPLKGKHQSEETNKKRSEALKGHSVSEETRQKMSEAARNRPEETRKKLSAVSKGKHWYNNGKINIRAKECPDGFIPGRIK